jgi:cyanate lyase
MAVALPELPPVHGQHRNRALAAARRARAVELRTTGLTYDQIATELGYANRGTVYHVVSEALKAQTAEAVGELRSLEIERLDNLQLAVWQKAMEGDVPSAIAVVRCILARCRLLGLDGPSLLELGDSRPRTLVVPPVT